MNREPATVHEDELDERSDEYHDHRVCGHKNRYKM